ncbi:VOC family protein [Risungbinella massiliensis]|uniref:VOC family protein n=1 Tax=Risungbinella massiliensis TaxID=1329796 RepID=UPI0005CC2DA2|nr:VOC family protein [Risungbinella massiliensis]
MPDQKIIPYLMFDGQAEEAMNYYISLFQNGEISFVQRYGDTLDDVKMSMTELDQNKIIHASFIIFGQTLFVSDKVGDYQDFPAGSTISLTLNCDTNEEIERIYNNLSENGKIMMPLQDTFWDSKYAVLEDKYGITWQQNHHKNTTNKIQ